MKIVRYFLGVMAAALMSGCATIGAIENNCAEVNRADGIDKDEAVAIAQRDLLHNEQARHRFRIADPRVFEGKQKTALFGGSEFETWTIVFSSKNIFTATFCIFPPTYAMTIDKVKGRIADRLEGRTVDGKTTAFRSAHVPGVLDEIDGEKNRRPPRIKRNPGGFGDVASVFQRNYFFVNWKKIC